MPAVLVWPSVKIRYSTWATAATRPGSSCAGGSGNRAPTWRSRALARLIRCAMVASGTRKARAIWPVVSPPTARRVSATCAGRGSAGWQHSSSSGSESSVLGRAVVGRWADQLVRRRPVRQQPLPLGAGLVGPPLVDQPAGRDGDQPAGRVVRHAVVRPLPRRCQQRLLQRRPRRCRSRRSGAPARPAPAARTRATAARAAGAAGAVTIGRRHWSSAPDHIAGRSSTVLPGPANWAAISSARSRVAAVDQEETGQLLLGLGVRAVGGGAALRAPGVDGRRGRVGQRLGGDELPRRRDLGQQRVELAVHLLVLLGRDGASLGGELRGRVPPRVGVAVDQDHVLHERLLRFCTARVGP